MSQKPKLPTRPEALAPYEIIPIQDPPSPGLSLKAYSFLYANLLAISLCACLFGVFGSVSWFFRTTPVAADPERLVVREMALFLETRPAPPRVEVPAVVASVRLPVTREPASVEVEQADETEPVYLEARDPDSPPQTWLQVSP